MGSDAPDWEEPVSEETKPCWDEAVRCFWVNADVSFEMQVLLIRSMMTAGIRAAFLVSVCLDEIPVGDEEVASRPSNLIQVKSINVEAAMRQVLLRPRVLVV